MLAGSNSDAVKNIRVLSNFEIKGLYDPQFKLVTMQWLTLGGEDSPLPVAQIGLVAST